MPEPHAPTRGSLPALALVVSRYNAHVTDRLLESAVGLYLERGGERESLGLIDAPGAFELTSLCHAAASSGLYRGVLALGCIVRGETRHDRYLASAVARGLTDVQLRTGVPVAFGVLTVEAIEQAEARAGGDKGDKGLEAMAALLDTLDSLSAIERARDRGDPEISRTLTREIAKLGGRGEIGGID